MIKTYLKKALSILSLVFVSLFSPLTALAFSLGDVVNTLKGVPSSFVNFVMGIFVYLAAVFAQIAGALLDWVTSPGFITLKYTDPTGNPIIEAGLDITKNFVNLSLVVILVFIAFAIALRLKEYATQKTLVRLIIIALLVNFAPILCGLIVDASNIIMNYFFVGIKEGISGILTDISTAGLTGTLTRPGSVTVLSILAKGAVMITLNLFIGLVFLLLVFIFVLRYVAIWILVILSPLAFVAWILPATKKLWDMWWKQLLNWSFIGIPMAFFLYLAMRSVAGLNTYFETKMTAVGLEPEVTGLLDKVFPYFAVLGILFFGFFIALSTTAIGSSSAIKAAKWTGRKTTGGAKWVGKKAGKGIGRWAEEKGRVREVVGRIPKYLEKHRGVRWFVPEPLKKYAEYRPAVEEAQKESKAYSSRRLGDKIMSREAIGKRAVGDTLEMISRGDSEDIFDAGRRKFGKDLTDEQLLQHKGFSKRMRRVLHIAKQAGLHNDIIRRDPRLASLMVGQKWGGDYSDKSPKEAIKMATRESRGGHIANWEKQVVSRKDRGLPVTEALMERGRKPFENISDNVKNGVETIQESIDTLYSNYIDNVLSKTNAKLANEIKKAKPGSEEEKMGWTLYHEQFKKDHKGKEGFFVALQSQRFRDIGYRQGRYMGTAPTEPEEPIEPHSPGGAAMGTGVPKGTRTTEAKKPKGVKTTGTSPRGTRTTGGKPPKGTRT